MEYLNSVGYDDGFCCCIDDLEEAVVIKRGADGQKFATAEVLRYAGAWFGMNDNWSDERSYGSGVEVEGAVEVLPGGNCRGNVVLSEEV